MSLNRIYQGRVHCLELLDGKEAVAEQALERAELQKTVGNPLWAHHEIFQAGVNYYLLALGSLAEDSPHVDSRLIRDLRGRLDASWERFPRAVAGGRAQGLRESLRPWLGLPVNASINEAYSAILQREELEVSQTEALPLALDLLLRRCGGEAAIQQGGRGYLPRFVDATSDPTWDFSKEALASASGKDRLAALLHAEALSEADLRAVAAEMSLDWTVKVTAGKFYKGEEARARLGEAVQHLSALCAQPPPRLKEVLTQFPEWSAELSWLEASIQSLDPLPDIPRNRKANKDLTFATLLFQHFPSPFLASVLRLSVARPGKKSAKPGKRDTDDAHLTVLGDDPIRLARGSRGFVFRAFTALPAWQPEAPGRPRWKEFDIAVFKEALKSLNQFNRKTEEREKERSEIRARIAYMTGAGAKPSMEEEDDPLLAEDSRYELALSLKKELTATHQFEEGEFHFNRSALRGLRDIRPKWVALFEKAHGEPLEADLIEAVSDFQRKDKRKREVGSVPLFRALCQKKYWSLWLPDAVNHESHADERAPDMLKALSKLEALQRDLERKQEPINLTPAEPRHSRRLCVFSDFGGRSKVVERGDHVEVSLAFRDDRGLVSEQRSRLAYTAPRLLRDELKGEGASRWLQPMMAALGLDPEVHDGAFQKRAVALMPDFDRQGNLRLLLNFPHTLDNTALAKAVGKADLWHNQFNGTLGKNLHLHWPETASDAARKNPWHENAQVRAHGFSVLAFDLGQRTAASWALLSVSTKKDAAKPSVEVGKIGDTVWSARVAHTGTCRLPGENALVRAKEGDLQEEPFGKRGRFATPGEYEEALGLARRLGENKDHLAWIGSTVREKSFAEQNEALVALAGRRLRRLSTYHRWSCLDTGKSEAVNAVRTELENYTEHAAWIGLLEDGEVEAFRLAAADCFERLRTELGEILLALANRTIPLRDSG